jgi:hypothetical protein
VSDSAVWHALASARVLNERLGFLMLLDTDVAIIDRGDLTATGNGGR